MRRLLIVLLAMLSFVAVSALTAQQEPARLALLIGNAGYTRNVGPLKNPHNDVALLEAALTKLRFRVKVIKDAGYADMDTAIKRHIADVAAAGAGAVSLFYYSGHGAANPDTQLNYLIPTDMPEADTTDFWIKSFDQGDLIEKLNRHAPRATHYVIFDACRNELRLSAPGKKSLGSEKGFVPVSQTAGLLIAYATAPKQTASDDGDGGGPYATALAAEIVKPGVEAVTMFRNVQLRVKQSIGQDPWLSFPSLPEVYLAGRSPAATSAPATTALPRSSAAEAWTIAESSNSEAALEAFLTQYGTDAFYATLAREKLAAIRQAKARAQQPAASSQSILTTPQVSASGGKQPTGPATPLPTAQSATPAQPPGQVFRDCPVCPEMVVVPAGSFEMGSLDDEDKRSDAEGPRKLVTITKPFAVGRFEVTFAEWDACVADGGCSEHYPSDGGWGRGKRPVINVTWPHAKAYTHWLSKKANGAYRLLTEAEWEYAARAGTTTPFSIGKTISDADANFAAWYTYSGAPKQGKSRNQTLPVGSFRANAFGLFDMHGNAAEWIEDCWQDNHVKRAADASAGPETPGQTCARSVRGGGAYDQPWALRSAARLRAPPSNALAWRGLRVARSLD